jgi:hypothetical protein
MPIIRSHLRNDPYGLTQEWPHTMMVQWGGAGLVMAEQPYQTAFFEVFPNEGGFIRGEGETIAEAERKAFEDWRRGEDCANSGGHRWSRVRRGAKISTYTNGGCFCIKCGTFRTVMKPIVKLGEWRQPLTIMALQLIALGGCKGARNGSYPHKLKLKAKLAGIVLPDDDEAEYDDKCRLAVGKFFHEHPVEAAIMKGHSLGAFIQELALRYLEAINAESPDWRR